MDTFMTWFMLAFAVAAVSITLTRSKITLSFREWLEREHPGNIAYLWGCPYCMSHWVAGAFALHAATGFVSWLIWTFSLVAASSIIVGTAFHLLLWTEMENDRLRKIIEDLSE